MIDSKIKGSIVNVSSVSGIGALRNVPNLPYNVSKAGLDMVTKQFALELGQYQIRVNSVNPTLVMTPMITNLKEDYEKDFIARTPMGRIAKVEEIVGPIMYLLSDYSSMVSGQIHPVDGGLLSNIAVNV
ncbi:L-xylulose reductase-like [Mercenaria mercenaria]|uniref:L-xylulose reductase-like n=1 Tax=Mercenaria mercenaria TaxID=6596 RepID=UPI00234EC05D|nr:L-xylulose reductase-like [Mercenaria mercenaria]